MWEAPKLPQLLNVALKLPAQHTRLPTQRMQESKWTVTCKTFRQSRGHPVSNLTCGETKAKTCKQYKVWQQRSFCSVGRGGSKSSAMRQSTQVPHNTLQAVWPHTVLCGISVLKWVLESYFCGHQAQGCSKIKPAPNRGDWHILLLACTTGYLKSVPASPTHRLSWTPPLLNGYFTP